MTRNIGYCYVVLHTGPLRIFYVLFLCPGDFYGTGKWNRLLTPLIHEVCGRNVLSYCQYSEDKLYYAGDPNQAPFDI
jgi:hypothetical protein